MRRLPLALATLTFSGLARAQCTIDWAPGPGDVQLDGLVTAFAELPNGDLVAGGTFDNIGTLTTSGIARWDGTEWHAFGSGLGGPIPLFGPSASALTVLPNGDLVVGGQFLSVDGVAANRIARFDGTSWHAMGTGMNNTVTALAALPNGDVIAGGVFTTAGDHPANCIARWDGTDWSAFGTGMEGGQLGSQVNVIDALPNGAFYAMGKFATANGVVTNGVAHWNGSTFEALGNGIDLASSPFWTVQASQVMPNGDLIVGGRFPSASGVPAVSIARWDGQAWHGLGSGVDMTVNGLATLPGGDLVAAGNFTIAGGVAAPYIARWDGAAWSTFGSPIDDFISTIYRTRQDRLLTSYLFLSSGAVPAPALLQNIDTSCPAETINYAPGCASSAGLVTLTADNAPWTGTTYTTTTTGLPPLSLVGNVIGFGPTLLPLALAFPQAGLGCTLFANPDLLDLSFAFIGSSTSAITLPHSIAFGGTVLYQQTVVFELDPLLNFVEITASNTLQTSIGFF